MYQARKARSDSYLIDDDLYKKIQNEIETLNKFVLSFD